MSQSNNYIVVRIEGTAKAGKTTVGQALLNILEKSGINARLTDGREEQKLSLSQYEKSFNTKALKSLKNKLSVDITTSMTFIKPTRDSEKMIDEMRESLQRKNDKISELESHLNGYKVLAERQKRELKYFREELSGEINHRIGLSVTLDMGLQQ